MSEGALLELSHVTLRFGGLTALDDVSFDVGRGELLALIGPNGAGKTSIFNCINQVYRPQRGSIRLDGTELVGRRPPATARAGVARTFQNVALFPNLSVIDNVMVGRHHLMRTGLLSAALWWGRARSEEVAHRRRCEEIVDLLELNRYRHVPVGVLPYGVQKRVELGRALAMEPKLLLLDEPVAGMNLEETEDMVRCLLDVGDALDLSTVLIAHDTRLVMDVSDRVLVLDFGRVLALGTPAEVQSDPAVLRAYLGPALAAEAGG